MRIGLSYLFAAIFGVSTAIIFKDSTLLANGLTGISKVFYNLGTAMFILLIIFTLPAAVASLKKDKILGKASAVNLLVIFKFAITLPVIAVLMFYLFKTSFPTTSSASLTSTSSTFISSVFLNIKSLILETTNFFTLGIYPYTLALPLVVLAIIIGLAFTPSTDVVKPAYVVLNSFSEVMYRLSKMFTLFSYIMVFFFANQLTLALIIDETIFVRLDFVIYVLAFTAITYLVVTPLIFLVFSKGKLNPYKKSYLGLSLMAFFSGSSSYTSVVTMNVARNNLGVQKRITSFATIINNVFAKGGTAAIATIVIFSLLHSYQSLPTSFLDIVYLLAFIIIASFLSSLAYNTELIFTVFFALSLANINLYGAEMSILGIVVLLNGLALVLDSQIALLSSALIAIKTNTDIEVAQKDLI